MSESLERHDEICIWDGKFEVTCIYWRRGFCKCRKGVNYIKDKVRWLPNANDLGIGGIIIAIKRGEWHEYGIYRWNDMMDRVFGEVNDKSRKIKI